MAKDKTQAADGAEKPVKAKASSGKVREEAGKDGVSLTGRVDQAKEFFEQSKGELKKVTWPTREETQRTTLIIIVVVVIISLLLGVMDFLISSGIRFLLGA